MVRFYRVPAVTGIVAVVVMVMGWGQINKILEQQRQLVDYKQQVAALDKRLAVLRDQAEGGLEQTKLVTLRALPEEKPVFEAFSALTALAGETGVTVMELSSTPGSLATASGMIDAGKGGVGGGARSIQMKLSVEGEELAVNNYLSKVIKVVPLVDLNTVKLSSGVAEGDQAVRYKVDVEMSVYWMPSFKSAATPSQTPELTPEQEQVVQDLLGYKYYGIN
jgi:hypothetical protein